MNAKPYFRVPREPLLYCLLSAPWTHFYPFTRECHPFLKLATVKTVPTAGYLLDDLIKRHKLAGHDHPFPYDYVVRCVQRTLLKSYTRFPLTPQPTPPGYDSGYRIQARYSRIYNRWSVPPYNESANPYLALEQDPTWNHKSPIGMCAPHSLPPQESAVFDKLWVAYQTKTHLPTKALINGCVSVNVDKDLLNTFTLCCTAFLNWPDPQGEYKRDADLRTLLQPCIEVWEREGSVGPCPWPFGGAQRDEDGRWGPPDYLMTPLLMRTGVKAVAVRDPESAIWRPTVVRLRKPRKERTHDPLSDEPTTLDTEGRVMRRVRWQRAVLDAVRAGLRPARTGSNAPDVLTKPDAGIHIATLMPRNEIGLALLSLGLSWVWCRWYPAEIPPSASARAGGHKRVASDEVKALLRLRELMARYYTRGLVNETAEAWPAVARCLGAIVREWWLARRALPHEANPRMQRLVEAVHGPYKTLHPDTVSVPLEHVVPWGRVRCLDPIGAVTTPSSFAMLPDPAKWVGSWLQTLFGERWERVPVDEQARCVYAVQGAVGLPTRYTKIHDLWEDHDQWVPETLLRLLGTQAGEVTNPPDAPFLGRWLARGELRKAFNQHEAKLKYKTLDRLDALEAWWWLVRGGQDTYLYEIPDPILQTDSVRSLCVETEGEGGAWHAPLPSDFVRYAIERPPIGVGVPLSWREGQWRNKTGLAWVERSGQTLDDFADLGAVERANKLVIEQEKNTWTGETDPRLSMDTEIHGAVRSHAGPQPDQSYHIPTMPNHNEARMSSGADSSTDEDIPTLEFTPYQFVDDPEEKIQGLVPLDELMAGFKVKTGPNDE